ncbi:MAG: flagellar filament capping protein FliD [Spirochaetales bacterium]|nr:flagellar filament capping protein FliD [Spirochaetales bacterium]
MSDFSIPGVSSKYNSGEAIQKLMEAERIPLARMEQDRQEYQEQKSAWLRLNRQIGTVRDSAGQLFGFQNPFNNKIATSSDQSVLTATAQRSALEEQVSVAVKQIATADRFSSRSLPRDFKAGAGVYRFRVGEEEIRFTFRGGSLKELAEAINTRAGKLLKATVIADTQSTQVLVVESRKTGAHNQLSFHDEAAAFGEQAGMLERSFEASRSLSLAPSSLEAWQKPLDTAATTVSDGVLTLNPGSELKLPIRPPHALNDNMVLSMQVRVRRIPEEAYAAPQPPPGPEVPSAGGIELQGIQVENAPSRALLPDWEPPEPPKRVDDLQVLFAQGGGATVPLPEVRDSEEFYTLEVPAGQLPQALDALALRNRNTHRIIDVRDVRIYDVTARGEHKAVNPLSSAQDAVVVLDGIEVTRDTNQIDDLLPGVELSLHAASERPVELTVAKDLEAVKDALFNFVGNYNKLLMEIDILTRQDQGIVENAVFLSDEEREQAQEDLGLLQGNVTLMQLKSRLQRIMMDPYTTEGGRELTLLAQIGISTSGGQFQTSGSIDRTLLRGYLQIDEAVLEGALNQNPDWVRQLFGFDRDKDLVVDSGVAFQVDSYLKPYVGTAGVVSGRVSAIDRSLANKDREIAAYNEHLLDYERELRRKFGVMEGALDTLEKSSQAIENLNRQTER